MSIYTTPSGQLAFTKHLWEYTHTHTHTHTQSL